ncbi:MICOS complex subunit Mic60-like isoform X2 [Artemia franciscana]|uniref:MICOS complex subunit MIC60 n=2 Tax=Artemia franciscana TaxID=6661 RepID=A0AA88L1I1_ARTSF|nr:hypothetical protein QYM36_013007 [Artemia franciscana]
MHRIGISQASFKRFSQNNVQQKMQKARMSSQKLDGRSKVTLILTGAAVAVGGTVAVAAGNPVARDWIESNVPGTSSIFSVALGSKPHTVIEKPASRNHLKPAIDSAESSLMKKKLEREAAKKREEGDALDKSTPKESLQSTDSSAPAIQLDIPETGIVTLPGSATDNSPESGIENNATADQIPESTSEIVSSSKTSVNNNEPNVEEEQAKSSTSSQTQPPMSTSEITSQVDDQEKPLEALLEDLERKANAAVREAVKAQDEAALAIRKHTDMVYHALDKSGEPNVTSQEVFQPVADAAYAKLDAVRNAETKLQEARELVAHLKEKVASGVKNRLLIKTPDLIMADEVAARSLYKLESARAKVQQAQADAKIMEEYRDLIDKARDELRLELSSILPEVSPNTKGAKLTDEEQNMLLAHAYRKIIVLQKELAKQQTLEQHRFRTALELQRQEDISNVETRIRVELEKQERESSIRYSKQLAVIQKELEAELHSQLKRQAAAHADHVTDLLAAQEKELSHKWSNHLQDSLIKEQLAYESKVAGMIGQIKGIERAIKGRVEGDLTFHKAQRLWSACQALVNAVTRSSSAKPWIEEITSINLHLEAIRKAAGEEDAFVDKLLGGLSTEVRERGVLPLSALKERFMTVERVGQRVALVDENGGSLLRYMMSYLQSMFLITAAIRPILDEKEIDIEALNPHEILASARFCLEKDDLEQAIRFVNLLRGEPRNVARDWLKEARHCLEVRQTAEALLVYASANGTQVL